MLNTLVFLFPFTCGRAHPHTRGEEHPTLPAANLSKTHTHLTVSRKSASPNESAPEASGWSKPHGLVDNKSVKKRVCFLDSSIAYAFLWNQTTSVFLSCFDSNRFVPANSLTSTPQGKRKRERKKKQGFKSKKKKKQETALTIMMYKKRNKKRKPTKMLASSSTNFVFTWDIFWKQS